MKDFKEKLKAYAVVSVMTVLALIWVSIPAFADQPDNRPPNNRPPTQGSDIDVGQDQGQSQGQNQGQAQGQLQGQAQGQTQQSSSTSTATSGAISGSSSQSSAAGGDGGAGGSASATLGSIESHGGDSYSEGGHATGGSGTASAQAGDASAISGDATATNAGVATDVNIEQGDTNFNSESTNTNVVLVPNNNTAGCNRVYGISFGNGEGAGALGVPFRDKSCDYEQAADDAAASGQHKIAWWWRCHKPNLYKTFRGKGETVEMAQLQCWNSMTSMLEESAVNFNEPQPTMVAADMLMADLSDEELDEIREQQQLAEERMNQQTNLIEALKADHDEKDAEIERLKRESARLKAEQEQAESKDAARRAAALKALSEKSEEK